MFPGFREAIEKGINSHGQHLVGVFPTAESPGKAFMYTIGNHLVGLPELLVIGAAEPAMGRIMNLLRDRMRETGKPFPHGETIDIGGRVPLMAIDADDPEVKESWTVQAGQYLQTEDYKVQQILIPDHTGKFPGDPECAEPYGSAPRFDLGWVPEQQECKHNWQEDPTQDGVDICNQCGAVKR